jgi:hypothetical protein
MAGFKHRRRESQTVGDQNIYDNSAGFTSRPIIYKNKVLTE